MINNKENINIQNTKRTNIADIDDNIINNNFKKIVEVKNNMFTTILLRNIAFYNSILISGKRKIFILTMGGIKYKLLSYGGCAFNSDFKIYNEEFDKTIDILKLERFGKIRKLIFKNMTNVEMCTMLNWLEIAINMDVIELLPIMSNIDKNYLMDIELGKYLLLERIFGCIEGFTTQILKDTELNIKKNYKFSNKRHKTDLEKILEFKQLKCIYNENDTCDKSSTGFCVIYKDTEINCFYHNNQLYCIDSNEQDNNIYNEIMYEFSELYGFKIINVLNIIDLLKIKVKDTFTFFLSTLLSNKLILISGNEEDELTKPQMPNIQFIYPKFHLDWETHKESKTGLFNRHNKIQLKIWKECETNQVNVNCKKSWLKDWEDELTGSLNESNLIITNSNQQQDGLDTLALYITLTKKFKNRNNIYYLNGRIDLSCYLENYNHGCSKSFLLENCEIDFNKSLEEINRCKNDLNSLMASLDDETNKELKNKINLIENSNWYEKEPSINDIGIVGTKFFSMEINKIKDLIDKLNCKQFIIVFPDWDTLKYLNIIDVKENISGDIEYIYKNQTLTNFILKKYYVNIMELIKTMFNEGIEITIIEINCYHYVCSLRLTNKKEIKLHCPLTTINNSETVYEVPILKPISKEEKIFGKKYIIVNKKIIQLLQAYCGKQKFDMSKVLHYTRTLMNTHYFTRSRVKKRFDIQEETILYHALIAVEQTRPALKDIGITCKFLVSKVEESNLLNLLINEFKMYMKSIFFSKLTELLENFDIFKNLEKLIVNLTNKTINDKNFKIDDEIFSIDINKTNILEKKDVILNIVIDELRIRTNKIIFDKNWLRKNYKKNNITSLNKFDFSKYNKKLNINGTIFNYCKDKTKKYFIINHKIDDLDNCGNKVDNIISVITDDNYIDDKNKILNLMDLGQEIWSLGDEFYDKHEIIYINPIETGRFNIMIDDILFLKLKKITLLMLGKKYMDQFKKKRIFNKFIMGPPIIKEHQAEMKIKYKLNLLKEKFYINNTQDIENECVLDITPKSSINMITNNIKNLENEYYDEYIIPENYNIRVNNVDLGEHFAHDRFKDYFPHQFNHYLTVNEFVKLNNLKTCLDLGGGSVSKCIFGLTNANKILYSELPEVISTQLNIIKKLNINYYEVSEKNNFTPDIQEDIDIITCMDVIEHILDPNQLMRTILLLKPNYCAISTPNRRYYNSPEWRAWYGNNAEIGPPGNDQHVREWKEFELIRYLNRFMDIIYVHEGNDDSTTLIIGKLFMKLNPKTDKDLFEKIYENEPKYRDHNNEYFCKIWNNLNTCNKNISLTDLKKTFEFKNCKAENSNYEFKASAIIKNTDINYFTTKIEKIFRKRKSKNYTKNNAITTLKPVIYEESMFLNELFKSTDGTKNEEYQNSKTIDSKYETFTSTYLVNTSQTLSTSKKLSDNQTSVVQYTLQDSKKKKQKETITTSKNNTKVQ